MTIPSGRIKTGGFKGRDGQSENSALDTDHIGAEIARQNPPAFCMGMTAGVRESVKLHGDYDRFFFGREDERP